METVGASFCWHEMKMAANSALKTRWCWLNLLERSKPSWQRLSFSDYVAMCGCCISRATELFSLLCPDAPMSESHAFTLLGMRVS